MSSKQFINNNHIINSAVYQFGDNTNINEELLKQITRLQSNDKLLNKLVLDNLNECRDCIIDNNFVEAQKIIDTIFTYGLNQIDFDKSNLLYFYKYILALFALDKEIMQACIDNITCQELKDELEFIEKLNSSPSDYNLDYYFSNSNKLLTFVILEILFSNQLFERIIKEFEPSEHSEDIQLYYFGVSCFNNGIYDEALKAAESAKKITNKPKYQFVYLISEICLLTEKAINIETWNNEPLKKVYEKLIEFEINNKSIVNRNKLIYTTSTLQAILLIDKNEFLIRYNSIDKDLKNEYEINFLLAQYYILINDFEKSIEILENVSEFNKEEVYFKLLFSYESLEQHEKVLSKFSQIDMEFRSSRIISIYLTAISFTKNDDEFYNEFEKYIDGHEDDLNYIFQLSLSANNNNKVKKRICICINKLIEKIIESKNIYKLIFARIAFDIEEHELYIKILYNIKELDKNSLDELDYIVSNIKDENIKQDLVEYFIGNNIITENILAIKINKLIKINRYISALKYLKDLFIISPTEKTAINIVNLINNNKVVSAVDYGTYLDFLEKKNSPLAIILCSIAYYKLGQYEKANLLAYRAIYNLNNEDNFEVYDFFMHVHYDFIFDSFTQTVELDIITGNEVVTLQNLSDNSLQKYCFNQENDLQKDIFSIGVQHLPRNNIIYLKLKSKKKGNIITYQNNKYIIKEILNKHIYTFRYVLERISKNVNKSSVILKVINTEQVEDLKQQLLEMIPNNNEIQYFLDLYHFINNESGISIESIINANYDNYPAIVKFLLFEKEQALYAGHNDEIIDKNCKLVVSLSTLVILNHLNKLDILNIISDNIFIPKSLFDFVQLCSENASRNATVSPGSLTSDGKEVAFIPVDDSLSDFWIKIYEVISKLTIVDVTNDERIALKIENLTLEELYIKFRFDICQLDVLVLSKKHNILLICDDLFFRKLCKTIGIRTVNFTAIYNLYEQQGIEEELLEISKTNYLFVSSEKISDTMALEIADNLLNSEIKKRHFFNHFGEMMRR